MALLVVGLVLFLGVHSIRVVAPAWRTRTVKRLGEQSYKAIYALASLVGLILIIWGFADASASATAVYAPAYGMRHATALLMVFALILAVASVLPAGRIKRWVRHPLLVAVILFAIGHLLANGDSAGLVLFGAFLAWAVIDLAAAMSRPHVRAGKGAASIAVDLGAVVIGLALFGLLIWRLHLWLIGVSPFG